MCPPSVDHAPFYAREFFLFSVDIIQTAARGTAAVLGILGERDGAFDAVFLHLARRLGCKGIGVTEGNICLVRCCFRVKFVQELDHPFALETCVP